MASAVMSRPSMVAAPSASRPSSAPARTACAPVASSAVAPRPAAGGRSRASAVTPQAFYGSCSPGVRMMRVTPRFFRRGAPSVFDSPIATMDWLSRTVAQPLQPMETATYDDRYELTSDVPGMGPEDIKVEITPEGVLRVEGSRPSRRGQPKAEADADADPDFDTWRRRAASSPSASSSSPGYTFSRSFSLPEDAVADEVAASLDKGVLTVTVPRRMPKPKPEPRRVRVSAQPKPPAQWPADKQQEQRGSGPLEA